MNRLRSLFILAIAIFLPPSLSVADDGSTKGWSEIITAAQLDAEAQRTLAELQKIVRDDASFAESQRQIAPHAAALACLAYIAQHHSKEIAWRAHAVTIQQTAIELSRNRFVLNQEGCAAATKRIDQLAALVKGTAPVNTTTDVPPPLNQLELALLMRRMELSLRRIETSIARAEDESAPKTVDREWALVATIAKVLATSAFEDYSDRGFSNHANVLSLHAHQAATAARDEGFQSAKAIWRIAVKKCSQCHQEYR